MSATNVQVRLAPQGNPAWRALVAARAPALWATLTAGFTGPQVEGEALVERATGYPGYWGSSGGPALLIIYPPRAALVRARALLVGPPKILRTAPDGTKTAGVVVRALSLREECRIRGYAYEWTITTAALRRYGASAFQGLSQAEYERTLAVCESMEDTGDVEDVTEDATSEDSP